MNDYYDQLKPAIAILEGLIKTHKKDPNIEIEIKIGRIEDNRFLVGLQSEDFYKKIKSVLETNNWSSIRNIVTEEHIYNSVKLCDKKYTKKTRLATEDFRFIGTPYDFRITVSREEPCKKADGPLKFIRRKDRMSYSHRECSFDLTKVEEEIPDAIIINEEFEIELTHLDSYTSDIYRAHSALLKIRDVINICEPISKTAYIMKAV